MSKQIISDIAIIKKTVPLNTKCIEEELQNKYGNIIRWAVIDLSDTELKVSITFEKDA